ncbi:Bax inhibitor-1/YccA family protein [Nocardioides euryhalodurans]|uniref:Bax inhibitor-1/YccA family protein n=1 Tax=Nocardioides euryhalodurans TaxID=2518370 RepID=A0A4P7GK57_9ACTN|nr:Bax inhibitor-1/YccA family protein [Nocardioides euryhalodurans]QBR92169.1 Bax inhibitor-1/YccA family protein [Nocardioides euryhalodurans]
MQSNNPVFRRSDAFNGTAAQGTNAYGNQTYPGNGAAFDGYGQTPTGYADTQAPVHSGERMTIDSVVQKTGISLAVVIVTAALTWWWTGDVRGSDAQMGNLYLALMVGSFGAFGLSMVNSFKRVVSPGLVLAFCALEGVALGAFSKFIDAAFVPENSSLGDNIVMQAVLGTFAAFAGTLAAYKFFDIKVGQRFRTFVIAAMFGMVALGLLEVVLGMFGNAVGFLGFGGAGLLFSFAGLVLGVFMLILDFDFVEQGIAAGIEERESWRAAFALTVSLVWIYTNLLRILAIFSQD